MHRTWIVAPALALSLAAAACNARAQTEAAAAADLACAPQSATTNRPSPYDSVTTTVGDAALKVCYGRPSARGRTMIGGDAVPFGRIWRTGANEPTIVHVARPVRLAGVLLEPGSYSLYTIPGEAEWTVILNRSISQWGHESRYTAEVQAQEVGRGTVPAERTDDHVETFTIRHHAAGTGDHLVLEWEHTRVRVPLARATD
jgi:hypothetical protein